MLKRARCKRRTRKAAAAVLADEVREDDRCIDWLFLSDYLADWPSLCVGERYPREGVRRAQVRLFCGAANFTYRRKHSPDPFTSIFHLASSPSLAIGNRPTVFTEPVVIHSGKDASRRVRTVRSRRAAALHSSPSPLGGRPPSFPERMERAHSIVCRPRTMLRCSFLFLPS